MYTLWLVTTSVKPVVRPGSHQNGRQPYEEPPPPPPPQTKVTIVGKNGIYTTENPIGPFLVHNFLGPRPPPPPLLCSNVSLWSDSMMHRTAPTELDGRGALAECRAVRGSHLKRLVCWSVLIELCMCEGICAHAPAITWAAALCWTANYRRLTASRRRFSINRRVLIAVRYLQTALGTGAGVKHLSNTVQHAMPESFPIYLGGSFSWGRWARQGCHAPLCRTWAMHTLWASFGRQLPF